MCSSLLQHELREKDATGAYNPQRWRRLADVCIRQANIAMALRCAEEANDLSFSLLLYSCVGDRAGLVALAEKAAQQEQLNIAFLALYLTGDTLGCIRLLQSHQKLSEAAFFALAYQPSRITEAFRVWQSDLRAHHHLAAELIANPEEYGSYFAGYEEALELEKQLEPLRHVDVKAREYARYKKMVEEDGIDVGALEMVDGEECEESGEECNESGEEKIKEDEEKINEDEEEQNEENNNATHKPEENNINTTDTAQEEPEQDEFEEIMEGGDETKDDGEDIDIDDLEREWS